MANAPHRLVSHEVVLHDEHWLCSQTWTRQVIVAQGPFRLRYTINCNAYKNQSDAVSEVWNERDLRWNTVHTIPGVLMKTDVSYASKTVKVEAFDEDLEVLRSVTSAIL